MPLSWSCTSVVPRCKPHCLGMILALTMRLASCMVGRCLLGSRHAVQLWGSCFSCDSLQFPLEGV